MQSLANGTPPKATLRLTVALAALAAVSVVRGELPNIVVIEAPFAYPAELENLLATASLPSHVSPRAGLPNLPPRTTWDVFDEFEQATHDVLGSHEHAHDMLGTCESCLAFQQSRRELMAQAIDQVIAGSAGETAIPLDADEVDMIRIQQSDANQVTEKTQADGSSNVDDDGRVEDESAGSDEEEFSAIMFGPLSAVGINTRPSLEKSSELPTDLASQRYMPYDVATRRGGGEAKPWGMKTFCWQAPSFYHRPLYFEQVNLERYGHYHKNWQIQSILSAAHFFGSVPVLPLQLGAYHPCERVYTLGRYRPGNCNPNDKYYLLPITWQGILLQGLTTTGLVFAL